MLSGGHGKYPYPRQQAVDFFEIRTTVNIYVCSIEIGIDKVLR
jgi:hypothetical protein